MRLDNGVWIFWTTEPEVRPALPTPLVPVQVGLVYRDPTLYAADSRRVRVSDRRVDVRVLSVHRDG
jgi:hypothetical protein